ncbi:MAG: M12 family metallo-peptidase [Opitutaceae bacterium]
MIPAGLILATGYWLVAGWRQGGSPSASQTPAQAQAAAGPVETVPLARGDRSMETGDRRFAFSAVDPDREAKLLELSTDAVRRVRVGAADSDFLDPKTSPFLGAPDGDLIFLELFNDLVLPILLTDTGVTRSGVQLIEGTVAGQPGSRFMMTASEGAASLSIEVSPDDRYVVNWLDDGVYEIAELDPQTIPPCHGPLTVFLDADVLAARSQQDEGVTDVRRPTALSTLPHTPAVVDLLIVYSSDVAANYTEFAIRNKAELAVAEGNSDFERSGARVQLRLVGVAGLDYTENGSNSDGLERLRRTSDGYMDDVHQLREKVGADLVCLLQDRRDSSSSGIAYVMTEIGSRYNEDFGFSVVEYQYLTGSNTMVHEIGHNLGCQHDRENSGADGLFPFSYGYRFTSGTGSTYRTIMAYRPGSRISYFSTPLKTFGTLGDPIGIAEGQSGEADNVESLNRASFEVSNFRLAEEGQDPWARLINVSTRAMVGAGERALIGGFVIGEAESKLILVRALGPSLADYGVRDPLPSLKVTLNHGGAAIGSNAGWRTAADPQAIMDTGYAPSRDAEPAFLVELGPGAYTAVVNSLDERLGVALVEIYEIGVDGTRLVNLSTRGYVGVAEDVMIGGFVIGGESGGTKRILLRALGPSLSGFGVVDALYDPAMTLYDESGVVLLENDDWDESNQQDRIADLGFAPAVRRESAMILDLSPGLYTVIVRPFENTDGQRQGIGLIEAFEIREN